ncbi:hypothetical protein GCM10010399_26110 [Dactylosporangium fulvum]|uniref:Uncharacterized protein n=1 Tax=Dactylosporangium fulvum TaxID=53359 RepID=A0ABY5WC41_9ACTN|nr:hypothetical protein [Dactylosporangium fulvum]UWP86910.1 hypothetical protein Dfulv_22765 [Dactylosporangium fulvum]
MTSSKPVAPASTLELTDALVSGVDSCQWARTLVLAGGEHATIGAAALADIGLAPMASGR